MSSAVWLNALISIIRLGLDHQNHDFGSLQESGHRANSHISHAFSSPNSSPIPIEPIGTTGLYTGIMYTIWQPKYSPTDNEYPLYTEMAIGFPTTSWEYSTDSPKATHYVFGSESYNHGYQLKVIVTDLTGGHFPEAMSQATYSIQPPGEEDDIDFQTFQPTETGFPTPSIPDYWILNRYFLCPPGTFSMHRTSPSTGNATEQFGTYGTLSVVSLDQKRQYLQEYRDMEHAFAKQFNIQVQNTINPCFKFKPAQQIIDVTLRDITYPDNTMDLLKNQSLPVSLVVSQTFINPTEITIKQTYSHSKQLTSTFSYGFSEGISLSTTFKGEAGIPLIATGQVTVEGDISLDADQKWTMTNTDTYKVSTEIDIPPFTSLEVLSYVSWVPNIVIPYTATMVITWGSLQAMEDLTEAPVTMAPQNLKDFLARNAPDFEYVGES